MHIRNRFQTASLTARTIPGLRAINPRTIRNRLREQGIRQRRPAVRSVLLRIAWCRRHLRVNRQDWAGIFITDESRFHLDNSNGRSRVCRRVGERFNDACVVERRAFGGGSVMVWGGITSIGRTPLDGNLNRTRYRDLIIQVHVILFVQGQ